MLNRTEAAVMISFRKFPGFACLRRPLVRLILPVVAVLLLAAPASAETLHFLNATDVPVIVQAACVVKGVVKRDKPVALNPGDTTDVTLPGNKLIIVLDGKLANHTLFQGTISASPVDLYFAITPERGGKVRMEPVQPGGMMGGPWMPGPGMPGPMKPHGKPKGR